MNQATVFGYGIIVPAEYFNEKFPGALNFIEVSGKGPMWEVNEPGMNDVNRDSDLVQMIPYTQVYVDHVFITTKDAKVNELFVGELTSFGKVRLESIIRQAELIKPWLENNFPEYPPGYYLYSYFDE